MQNGLRLARLEGLGTSLENSAIGAPVPQTRSGGQQLNLSSALWLYPY